jgi:hypothetical protein
MGFPVIDTTIAASFGAHAQFARGLTTPGTRNVRTQRRQAGNSMHVNVMGAFQFMLYAKFPGVGCLTGDYRHDRLPTDTQATNTGSGDREEGLDSVSKSSVPRACVGLRLGSIAGFARDDVFDGPAFKFARGTGGVSVYQEGLATDQRHVV